LLVSADVQTIVKTITGKDNKATNREGGFPDGDFTLFQFIAGKITYLVSALARRLQGTVYVSFSIDLEGYTKEVKILRGIEKELDDEALRVIRLIKKWLPAIQYGNPGESTITIPVKFQLKL
jgi:TonB family protein